MKGGDRDPQFEVLSWHLPTQANRSLGRHSNPGPIEHEAGMLPTLPPRSAFKLQVNYSRLNGSKQFPNLICS